MTRLRETKMLPGAVACLMQTLNSLRNIIVYEGYAPGAHERAVVSEVWAAVRQARVAIHNWHRLMPENPEAGPRVMKPSRAACSKTWLAPRI